MSSKVFQMKTNDKALKEYDTILSTVEGEQRLESAVKATGRWTRDEHYRFLEALKMYGKEWKKVQSHVGTRSST